MTDLIVEAARFLSAQIEYSRHQPWVDEFYAAVAQAAGEMRFVVNGPDEQKYLGPCGAALVGFDFETDRSTIDTCEGDVYAYRGAKVGRCKTCGAEVATGEREAWLDGEVRTWSFRASEIAGAHRINVNTIRSWHARGQLAAHGHDSEGRPLFNVGEVLDLAAADAARRATEQAKRARRRERAALDNDGRLSA
jgi:hypothetical protein